MMRKYYILASLCGALALSTNAQAVSTNEQESPTVVQTDSTSEPSTQSTHSNGGFYVGGGVNFGWADYDMDTKQTTSVDMLTEPYSNSETVTGNGIGGQLFAGYDFYINPTISIALEAQFSASDTESDIKHSTSYLDGSDLKSVETKGKIKQDWTVGLALLPTYHYVNTGIDLFGVVGWQLSRFNISGIPGDISPLNRGVAAAYDSLPMASVNESKTLNGVVLGFGMKKKFTESLGMRLEYNWTRFSSFNASGTSSSTLGSMPSVDYTNSTEVSVKPTVQLVKLSLVYDF